VTDATETKQPEYIYKVDGSPFADLRAACGQKVMQERQGVITKPVELEGGGFALEVIKRKRPGRVPLGIRNVLTVKDPDPNYVERWVSDKHGRIEMFQEAGWEVVHGDEKAGDEYVGNTRLPGSAITKPAGSSGRVLVRMRKRRDWFEEDEQVKQDNITEAEQGLIHKAQLDNLHAATGYKQGIQIAHVVKH
jgi:hypothetical protein